VAVGERDGAGCGAKRVEMVRNEWFGAMRVTWCGRCGLVRCAWPGAEHVTLTERSDLIYTFPGYFPL